MKQLRTSCANTAGEAQARRGRADAGRRSWIRHVLAVAAVLLLASWSAAAADKPASIVPGERWHDRQGEVINAHGAGMLKAPGGSYYWFGEYKTAGKGGNAAHVGVSVYQSRDLLHWDARGIALPVSKDPASDIADGAIIERPKVLHNVATGKYVMWFHLERAGHGYKDAHVGVAVADAPAGPYRYLRSFQPNGQQSRDMTLFQDEDGTAYLFYSSEGNATMHVTRLTADYLDTEQDYQRIFVDQWLEAPAIFKHAGRYFFMGSECTGWKPNTAHGASAASPLGPWTEFGNPAQGEDAALTFHSQSAYILPMPGQPGRFIYMGDRWNPENAIDGRYVWLPLQVEGDRFRVDWHADWSLERPAVAATPR
ncbi:beta-glucanase [Pseudoxanthomonas winnipegensis]|uniref:Beta-glucanase n=1 Tax=Pseudoxanthomonas winnipegensis TaxID=2480810 RepID=A0ABY1WF39_9GAMM|nr:beta-glucanase [Pseudoxanthomonas winnipegensis]TAA20573.1 beta-glucanase [Pseudoxanthomonas winnipegensis]TAH71774.1 beta-glucanase [Pseudoxanthomonas winnipegensis]